MVFEFRNLKKYRKSCFRVRYPSLFYKYIYDVWSGYEYKCWETYCTAQHGTSKLRILERHMANQMATDCKYTSRRSRRSETARQEQRRLETHRIAVHQPATRCPRHASFSKEKGEKVKSAFVQRDMPSSLPHPPRPPAASDSLSPTPPPRAGTLPPLPKRTPPTNQLMNYSKINPLLVVWKTKDKSNSYDSEKIVPTARVRQALKKKKNEALHTKKEDNIYYWHAYSKPAVFFYYP